MEFVNGFSDPTAVGVSMSRAFLKWLFLVRSGFFKVGFFGPIEPSKRSAKKLRFYSGLTELSRFFPYFFFF